MQTIMKKPGKKIKLCVFKKKKHTWKVYMDYQGIKWTPPKFPVYEVVYLNKIRYFLKKLNYFISETKKNINTIKNDEKPLSN